MPSKLFYSVGKENNDDLFLLEETHQPIAYTDKTNSNIGRIIPDF